MFSKVMYTVESQVTRRISNAATKKISDIFSGKKKTAEKTEKEVTPSTNEKDKLIIASLYVGFAASYADGVLDDQEIKSIDKFKEQLAANGNQDLVIEVMKIKGEKPSFEDAMKHVDEFPKDMLSFFNGIIDDILNADGQVSEEEKVFLEKWEQYKTKRA